MGDAMASHCQAGHRTQVGSAPDDERAQRRDDRDDGHDADDVEEDAVAHHDRERHAPGAYTMALHGMDTGKRKPSDAPMVAATTGSVGSMPAERANAITTGTTIFADAVLLVVSDSTVASSVDIA